MWEADGKFNPARIPGSPNPLPTPLLLLLAREMPNIVFPKHASFVDTVPYGAYKKETLTALGGYDESLPINEDYDLNTRIRRNGGKILV
jgi:hypothetical protein